VSHALRPSIDPDCISHDRLGVVLGPGERGGAEEHTCGRETAASGIPHNDVHYCCISERTHAGSWLKFALEFQLCHGGEKRHELENPLCL